MVSTEHRVPVLGPMGADSDPLARTPNEDRLGEGVGRRGRTVTALLINLTMTLERLTEQILPAMSRTLACALDASPLGLGWIAFWRAFVQSLTSPLGGVAGHTYNRIVVLVVGCAIWVACAAAFAFVHTQKQAMMVWGVIGLGLGLIIPNAQAVVADYYPAARRGLAFGTLQLTSALGAVVGTLYATLFNDLPFCHITRSTTWRYWVYDNWQCWRFTFGAVAGASLLLGLCTCRFATDPSCPEGQLRQARGRETGGAAGGIARGGGAVRRRAPRRAVAADVPPAELLEAQTSLPSMPANALLPLLPQDARLDTAASGGVASALGAGRAPGGGRSSRHRRRHSSSSGSSTDSLVEDSGGLVDAEPALMATGGGDRGAGRPSSTPPLTRDSLLEMLTMPTFLIIVLQGSIGSTPAMAMGYLTWYLQALGMTNAQAGALTALYLVGGALGGLLGGWIGDVVARRYPNSGRIAVVQCSVAVGVPLSALLILGLPKDCYAPDGPFPPPPPPPASGSPGIVPSCFDASTFALYATLLFFFGLLTSWAAPACNNPVFSEIVPAHMRTLIYSFDRSFEGAVSAMGTLLVTQWAQGLAAANGVNPKEDCDAGGAALGRNLGLAEALGHSLLACMVISWTLCVIFYTGLYWTYPRDRDHARRRQARALSAARRSGGGADLLGV